jgi:hypothetical protein
MSDTTPNLWSERRASIAARFAQFHAEHPEVYAAFRRFAGELVDHGHTRGSADAILHRVRWETALGSREGFKINNDFAACYARLLAQDDARFSGFFEFRKSKADAA